MLRAILAPTIISALAGLLLAATNMVTREPIAATKEAERLKALQRVLPEYDNDPVACTNEVTAIDGRQWIFHVARHNGDFAGAAFESSSAQGYAGAITILAGIAADDTLQGLEVIAHKETPGLGAKIIQPYFKDQFKGKPLSGFRWAVRKDGGEVDAITGATISSRAVTQALRDGLDVYLEYRAVIAGTGTRP